ARLLAHALGGLHRSPATATQRLLAGAMPLPGRRPGLVGAGGTERWWLGSAAEDTQSDRPGAGYPHSAEFRGIVDRPLLELAPAARRALIGPRPAVSTPSARTAASRPADRR